MRTKIARKPDPFDIALYGLILTAVIAVTYILQLRSMQGQQKSMQDQVLEARKQTAEMQRQTEISERPWLSVEVAPASGLMFVNRDQATLAFKLSIRNVGRSIAKKVQTTARIFPSAVGVPIAFDAAKRQRELCDRPEIYSVGSFDLFPTDHPIEREVSNSTGASDMIAQSVTLPGNKPRRFVGLYVVGCVLYHSSFGDEVHETRFAYHLTGPLITSDDGHVLTTPNGTSLLMAFEIGVNVPKEKLGMLQEIVARNDAN